MVSLLSLNVNGIHDSKKWSSILNMILSISPNIVSLQETHLTKDQEYLFSHALPNFSIFYDHGTSNSAGVLTAVRHSRGINARKINGNDGRIITIECMWDNEVYKVINIYALNDHFERLAFFNALCPDLQDTNVILYGDFNLVLSEKDCLSRQTDDTTKVLNDIIQEFNLVKPSGFSQYTYQHPSILTRKSRIDLFLVSSQISCGW